MVNEAFAKIKIDKKSINYIPIKKDQFLLDVKKFLYNYCTTGRLYPNYQSNIVHREREDLLMNSKAVSNPKMEKYEDHILHNKQEFDK